MVNNENKPLDGSMVMPVSVAKKALKDNDYKISNSEIDAFVSLKDINKIYPNGVQAVYDFNIDISEKDFIVLVGPSGCGKSTTLRMVAGLEDITSGYLYIDKALSNYTSSKDRDISMVFQNYALYPQMTVYDNIAFPLRARKYKRPMEATVAKSWDQAIDVLENRAEQMIRAANEASGKSLNYGTVVEYVATKLKICDGAAKLLCDLKLFNASELEKQVNGVKLLDQIKATAKEKKEKERAGIIASGYEVDNEYRLTKDGSVQYQMIKMSAEEIRQRVFEAAEILDLGPYLDRRPKELSGGQMQRVALGRAIVRNAKLFLMDEPLSNLDAKLRVQMRSEIVRIHEQIGATTIYVTHDQTEAMTMATKIVVMSKGWVQQVGTPQEIYYNPKNIFVATFIGSPAMNIFDATYDNGVLVFKNGYSVVLPEEYKKRHNDYYEEKIRDLKRMLDSDDFKKMHALKVLDGYIFNPAADASGLKNTLDEVEKIVQGTECADIIKNLVASYIAEHCTIEAKINKKALLKIREPLLTFEKIPSRDIGTLHNAQVFSKEEIVVKDTLYYQKPKKGAKKNTKLQVNLNSTDIEFINNLYEVAITLLDKCEKALNGSHPIRVGVRPEDILLNSEFSGNKTDKFTVKSDIVELLGSELLIHSEFAESNMIAKISTNLLIKPHTDVELTMNKDKILIFDESCGDRIL